ARAQGPGVGDRRCAGADHHPLRRQRRSVGAGARLSRRLMPKPTFRAAPVRVRVPATSANLGPGFDALGLALSLYDDVTAQVSGSGIRVRVAGEGAGELPDDESHLVVRCALETFDRLGTRPPGLE